MLDYDNDKIKYVDLKSAVMAANESGILAKNIRYAGIKGPQLYESFLETIEALSREDQVRLPDEVANFYDMAMFAEEEDAEPLLTELDFGDDSAVIPEQVGDDEIVDEAENEMEATEEWVEDKSESKESSQEAEVIEEVKEPDLETLPPKKMQKLAKTPMTVTVIDKLLTIDFKELEKSKKFKLPEPENIEEFKPIRKKALAFAKENEATAGQIAAVCKTLNIAGYYTK